MAHYALVEVHEHKVVLCDGLPPVPLSYITGQWSSYQQFSLTIRSFHIGIWAVANLFRYKLKT